MRARRRAEKPAAEIVGAEADDDDDDDDDDDGQCDSAHLTAHYQVETFCYYYTEGDGDGDDGGAPNDDNERLPPPPPPPPVSVRVESATRVVGGQIVSDAHDATGLMIWPATHLLCQYLLVEQQQQEQQQSRIGTTSNATATATATGIGRNAFAAAVAATAARTVVELGCGCGLVGMTAALLPRMLPPQNQSEAEAAPRDFPPHRRLWVSTDGDAGALRLCRDNYRRNGVVVAATAATTTTTTTDTGDHGTSQPDGDAASATARQVWVQKLKWGSAMDIAALLDRLRHWERTVGGDGDGGGNYDALKFGTVVAADIVYPATCRPAVLPALLAAVDALLSAGGTFVLAFCSRDGPVTPAALVAAASHAGFAIRAGAVRAPPPPHQCRPQQHSSSLSSAVSMGAKILLLQRSADAARHNARLGETDDCPVFPGLHAALARRNHPSLDDADEVWDGPPLVVGSDDDDDDPVDTATKTPGERN